MNELILAGLLGGIGGLTRGVIGLSKIEDFWGARKTSFSEHIWVE